MHSLVLSRFLIGALELTARVTMQATGRAQTAPPTTLRGGRSASAAAHPGARCRSCSLPLGVAFMWPGVIMLHMLPYVYWMSHGSTTRRMSFTGKPGT